MPRGGPPLGAPGGFVDFLSMKIDSDAATRTGLYKKGLRPQGLGLLYFFSLAPTLPRGPQAPSLYSVGSRVNIPAGFPEKKTGRPSGVLRGIPPWNPRVF